jgi:autotransporter-associated beta strand protein
MLKFILVLVFVLFGAGCFKFSAQNLTISSSGQTGTSGTNWSINSNTLTVTGTANIRPSVIQNALASGSLNITGNSTTFNVTNSNAVTSATSGSSLTFGSTGNTGNITLTAGLTINGPVTINGGAVSLNAATSIQTNNTTVGDITINATTISGVGNLVVAANRIASITISSASTYAGIISGSGSSFTKGGNGNLTITKNQTYTGATTISAGILELLIRAAGGTLSSSSAVVIQTAGTLKFNTKKILEFPNSISGSGLIAFAETDSLRISANLTSTAVTIEINSNVLDVLQRITEAEQYGAATNATGGVFPSGANFKRYDPVANEGHVQFQQRDLGTDFKTVTVFALLQQSGANVTIKINTAIFGTGAAERPKVGSSTYHIGVDNSTTGSSIPLATTNISAGAVGIRKIQMSGIVYLTGSISFSGTIQTLASTQSLNDGNNAYSRKRIGAFGITGATLPATISNAGYFSLKASSALTLSGAISSNGTTAQFGAPVTLTGANTFNGYTIITSGKVLNVGNGGSTGAIQGNIENYGSLTFNRSDSIAYTGIITGTGSVTKSGASALTMTGLNTYTGATTINAGRLIIQQNTPTSSSSGFSGSGMLFIQPNSNIFTSAVTYPIPGFTVSSSIGGLTVGKTTNTTNITFGAATTIAGPITAYGGTIAVNGNIASSNGSTISLFGNALTFGTSNSVTSSNGQLIVAPQTASNTIGLGGASGTLSLPASYFSTNFADGFSNIQIGSNTQTGNISSNAFTLLDNMKILTSGSLTLGGKPVLGMNNLTLGSDIVTVNVGSPANYFQTTGSGKVVREISSGTSRLLPVGNLYYNPLTVLNNTGSADFFSARVLDSVCLNGLTGPVITSPHVKVTWDIDKVNLNTGSGIDMEFGWDATQEIGSINGYKVNHHDGTSWSFAAGTSNTPVGTAYKTLTHSGYTGTFSPFDISESSFPMPVTLINLSASCASSKVELSWQTASEWHSDYFQVEYSLDGTEWLALEKVPAAGNSTSLQQYTYSDLTPSRLMRYYRLKQVDLNGQYEIYGPIASECIVDGMDFTIYPNPSSTSATIQLLNTKKETAEIKLLDISGKEFWSQELELVNGTTSMVLSTENLAPGIYIIVLSSKDGILTNKLVVE